MTTKTCPYYQLKNMMNDVNLTKAQIAGELGVSRAYITMVANGKRKPSQDIISKLKCIYSSPDQSVNTGECILLTLNQ